MVNIYFNILLKKLKRINFTFNSIHFIEKPIRHLPYYKSCRNLSICLLSTQKKKQTIKASHNTLDFAFHWAIDGRHFSFFANKTHNGTYTILCNTYQCRVKKTQFDISQISRNFITNLIEVLNILLYFVGQREG